MTSLDPRLFADPPARDARFEVRQVWAEMENIWDDGGKMLVEFLHRQMNEEVNGLEIAARNLTDFPDADWDLRLAIARQCWDEARHVEAFRRCFERRGGAVGAYPVLNFEYRMATAISTLIGRLAVQNRSFEAAGIQAVQDALRRTTEADLAELFDAQLADEIQHVRYANRWVTDLVRRDARRALDVVRAISQANEAFRTIAGDALVEITLDDDMKREVGLLETEAPAAEGPDRRPMEVLSADRLASVASLWRSTRREVVTSFQGTSMLPTIAPGQRVVLRCDADVRPGDIVAILRGPELLVHRLAAVSPLGRWWLLKGDANRFCDLPVTSSETILGRIEKVERDGAFVNPPQAPRARRARLLTAGTAFLLEVSLPAGSLLLRAVTAIRRLLLRTYGRLRRPASARASPPATPS